ncbi:MAG: hypothetical protein WCO98_01595 [bacterium]
MIAAIVYGKYRFWRKIVGCRKDFCNHCKKEILSEQWRAFYFFHFFYIPLIPLGFYKYWRCSECNNDPRQRVDTGWGMKLAGSIIFGLFFVGTLLIPAGEDAIEAWVLRIIMLAGTIYMIYSLCTHKNGDLNNEQVRKQVKPITDNCPYCSDQLYRNVDVFCPKCKVKIYQE